MNRSAILAASMLAPPHPRYGVLSYGRFDRISKLAKKIEDADSKLHTALAWFVCTRPHDDPGLLELLAMDSPLAAAEAIFQEQMPFAERVEFVNWFDGEMSATDAASTKPKEQSVPGKPAAEPAAVAPTS